MFDTRNCGVTRVVSNVVEQALRLEGECMQLPILRR
jgi:hypothetical protein